MKRLDLIRAIEKMGCVFMRPGGKHDMTRLPSDTRETRYGADLRAVPHQVLVTPFAVGYAYRPDEALQHLRPALGDRHGGSRDARDPDE